MRRKLILIVCMVAALAAPPLASSGSKEGDPEAFRAELHAYLDGLRALPIAVLETFHQIRPASLDQAERAIEALSAEELLAMQVALENVPYWSSLPGLLATTLPSEQFLSPLELAATLDTRLDSGLGAEGFRNKMLSLIDNLGRVRNQVPPQSKTATEIARTEQLKSKVANLDAQQLMILRQAMMAKLPEWRDGLERSREAQRRWKLAELEGPVDQKALSDLINCPLATTSSCSSSFPDGIICELENVINSVINVPCDILDLAEVALDFIFDSLVELFSLIEDVIPEAQDLVVAMGAAIGVDLTDSDWIVDFFGSLPPLAIPCPIDLEANPLDDSFEISAIGTMGTFDAQFVCQRNLQFLASIPATDIAPDDVWGFPIKLVFQVLAWPIEYLCLCFEAAAEIQFDDDQATHRDLTAAMLDTQISTRATQTSVDSVQSSTDDVQSDVDSLDSSVADLDSDVVAVDDQVEVLNDKMDDALADSGEQLEFIEDFQELSLRLRIEADLIRDGNERISLFQLPASVGDVGGFLELVQDIVVETLGQRALAGRDVGEARFFLQQGDRLYSEQSYKKAYTQYRNAYRALVEIP